MNDYELNDFIAEKVMGFQRGSFGCVDGKVFKWRDINGNQYFENDYCFPDFVRNISESILLLNKTYQFEISKFTASFYVVSVRLYADSPLIEATDQLLSRSICKAIAKAYGARS
jgi:hypothetical protein